MTHVAESITRHPWRVLLVAGVLVAVALLLMSRLRAQTSLDAMLDPTDPATAAMGRVLEGFPVAEELLVMVSLPGGEHDASDLTAFAGRLKGSLDTEPSLVRAVRYRPSDQAREFFEKVVAPAGLLYLDDAQLADARARLSRESMQAQFERNAAMLATPGPAAGAVAKAILQDPLRLHELLASRFAHTLPGNARTDGFFSPTGRDLLIRIEGTRPLSDLDFAATLTTRVKTLAEAANTDSFTLQVGGGYAIAAHNAAAIRRDSIVNSVSTVIALCLLFVLLFRRPFWTFTLAFVPVACGIVVGFGIYAISNTTVTPLAMVIGGALGGIGIDYTIHMLTHRREDESPAQLARQMFWPLVAACATSVIGFAVIGVSPVRLLRDFSLVGSLALAGAFVASLTVLPAMLAIRGATPRARVEIVRRSWSRPRGVLVASIIILVPLVVLAIGADITRQDADLHNLHPKPNPPLEAQALIADRMGMDAGSLLVHVRADSDHELLERSADVQRRLASAEGREAGVSATIGPATFLPAPGLARSRQDAFSEQEVARILADFDATVAASDFAPEAYRPYRELLPRLLRPAGTPALTDLRQFPDLAETVLPSDPSSHDAIVHVMFEHPPRTRDEVQRSVAAVESVVSGVHGATVTGMSVISQRTLDSVQRDLPRVAILAIGCIAAYLALHYRSLLLAILAVVPMLVSMIGLLAMMRVTGMSLNVVNMVMLPLLLGINIDFGIFAADALRERAKMDERFVASVRAMLTCSLTTILGFGSLATTSIPAVQSLGVLVIVGVVGCALGTAFVLWPIVLIIGKRGTR